MRLLSLILLSSFLLAACGTKGPLYIPERQYPQNAPVSKPAPAPVSAVPAPAAAPTP